LIRRTLITTILAPNLPGQDSISLFQIAGISDLLAFNYYSWTFAHLLWSYCFIKGGALYWL